MLEGQKTKLARWGLHLEISGQSQDLKLRSELNM